MSLLNDRLLDAWMDARVEAYIDDDLLPDERARFEARLRTDPYWQEQVERARSIRTTLRSTSAPSPPTDLTDTILGYVASPSCQQETRDGAKKR
jgi:anti-sigma factor RsiW